MSEADRRRWDERHAADGVAPVEEGFDRPPPALSHVEHLLPRSGRALEVACGRGRGVVWMARSGLEVWAVDVSSIAIDLAQQLVEAAGVADRCHLWVHDLDEGLPPGPPVDLLLCHLYRDPRLYHPMMERLTSGGVLAIVTLSEVGASPGDYRSAPGELPRAFAGLDILEEGESDGIAWLVGRRRED